MENLVQTSAQDRSDSYLAKLTAKVSQPGGHILLVMGIVYLVIAVLCLVAAIGYEYFADTSAGTAWWLVAIGAFFLAMATWTLAD